MPPIILLNKTGTVAASSKKKILKKIRKALTQSTPLPFPDRQDGESVFPPQQQDLEVQFAEEFSKLQGKFVFCLHEDELLLHLTELSVHEKWTHIYCSEEPLQQLFAAKAFPFNPALPLKDADVSITLCECLVARTGTIVMSAAQQHGRTSGVYAPIHVCIAYTDQLVYDVNNAFDLLRTKYGDQLPSLINFASGPSRTADIEKTLVVGVHGPKEVYVFLVDA